MKIEKHMFVPLSFRPREVAYPTTDTVRYAALRPMIVAFVLTIAAGCQGEPQNQRVRAASTDMVPTAVYQFGETITRIACSPDGKTAAVARGSSNAVSLLDLVGGNKRTVLQTRSLSPGRLAFSPKGEYLAVGCVGRVELCDMRSKAIVRTLDYPGIRTSGLVFSTSGQYLYVATGQPEAIVRRLDVQTWEVKVVFREADEKALARFLAPNIYGLAIAPDDRTLAICLGDGTVLFDLASETTNFAINNGRAGASILAFSPNGSLLAKATRTAELWDPATRQLHAAYPTGMVTALAFSPRRMLLVTLGEGLLGRPGRADVWSVKDGEHLVTFPCHTDAITAMVFVPGTESIITGSCDGNVAIWDLSRFAQGVPEWQGIKPADKSNDK